MEYQFSFDKKRLFVLLLGLFLAGGLTFVCGVVTGIGLWKSGRPMATAAPPDPKGKAAPAMPALKVPAPPAVPTPALTAKALPAPTAAPAPVPAPAPAPAPVPVIAAPIATAAVAAPADVLPAAAVAAAPSPADQPFVLQVGAFREQKNAKQLQADLTKKGYATTILNMVDQDQRTWHMVRFGGYKDMSAAAQAASDFTGKEGIQAFVRRSDSL